jgi:enoyl-CoA hydratase/carnithine racemase
VTEAVTYVKYEVKDRLLHLTLDAPERLNAWGDEDVVELREALIRFDLDDDAWVAVLSGAGKSFHAGANMKSRHSRSAQDEHRLAGAKPPNARNSDLLRGFVNWKPVIAAVHGHVLGGGFNLAMGCDLVVAAENTKFGLFEVRRGIRGGHGLALLRELKGAGGLADELALTDRTFGAAEALAAGVVSRVAPDGEHVAVADEIARQCLELPPLAVRSNVRLRRHRVARIADEFEIMTTSVQLHQSNDYQEAKAAFREKRKPKFTGT